MRRGTHLAENVITLTNSLSEFLVRFITGGVFGGLCKWPEEIEQIIVKKMLLTSGGDKNPF